MGWLLLLVWLLGRGLVGPSIVFCLSWEWAGINGGQILVVRQGGAERELDQSLVEI